MERALCKKKDRRKIDLGASGRSGYEMLIPAKDSALASPPTYSGSGLKATNHALPRKGNTRTSQRPLDGRLAAPIGYTGLVTSCLRDFKLRSKTLRRRRPPLPSPISSCSIHFRTFHHKSLPHRFCKLIHLFGICLLHWVPEYIDERAEH